MEDEGSNLNSIENEIDLSDAQKDFDKLQELIQIGRSRIQDLKERLSVTENAIARLESKLLGVKRDDRLEERLEDEKGHKDELIREIESFTTDLDSAEEVVGKIGRGLHAVKKVWFGGGRPEDLPTQ